MKEFELHHEEDRGPSENLKPRLSFQKITLEWRLDSRKWGEGTQGDQEGDRRTIQQEMVGDWTSVLPPRAEGTGDIPGPSEKWTNGFDDWLNVTHKEVMSDSWVSDLSI